MCCSLIDNQSAGRLYKGAAVSSAQLVVCFEESVPSVCSLSFLLGENVGSEHLRFISLGQFCIIVL